MRFRRLHRLLGVTLAVLVVNAAATGLLRANAKSWYWTDRSARTMPDVLPVPDVSIARVIGMFPSGRVQRIELKQLAGRPVYLVEGQLETGRYALVDAQTGRMRSPINRDQAVEIARVFVPEQTAASFVEASPAYRKWKSRDTRPVWQVGFSDPAKTEVVVDQESGQAVDVLDRGRRFGMWVVRFHELDLAGSSRAALTLTGVAMIALALTGLRLAWKRPVNHHERH